MNNDYILLLDESGEPYLAHAWLRKGESHKYIYKKENFYGPGKHLYLYTQKEVNDFLRSGGKRNRFQRMKDRFRDKLGWDEQSDLEYARARGDKNIDAYQSKYRKTAIGKYDKTSNYMKTKLGDVRKTVEDKTGITQKKDLEKAKKNLTQAEQNYDDIQRTSDRGYNADKNTIDRYGVHVINAQRSKDFAESQYNDTSLGRAEKWVDKLFGKEKEVSYGPTKADKITRRFEKEELETYANRQKINTDYNDKTKKNWVSKEYIYDLGYNTGHSTQANKAYNAELDLRAADFKYNTAKDSASIIRGQLNLAKWNQGKSENGRFMEDATEEDLERAIKAEKEAEKALHNAEAEYDRQMQILIRDLNNDVDKAKNELKKYESSGR